MNETPDTSDLRDRVFTRRNYMTYRTVMEGTHALQAMDAMDSWGAIDPDVDMDEEMTWAEWEKHEAEASEDGEE